MHEPEDITWFTEPVHRNRGPCRMGVRDIFLGRTRTLHWDHLGPMTLGDDQVPWCYIPLQLVKWTPFVLCTFDVWLESWRQEKLLTLLWTSVKISPSKVLVLVIFLRWTQCLQLLSMSTAKMFQVYIIQLKEPVLWPKKTKHKEKKLSCGTKNKESSCGFWSRFYSDLVCSTKTQSIGPRKTVKLSHRF